MRSSALLVALVAAASVPIAAQYRLAAPGYHFQFPRDHFDHPDYQTEWWYYTGNLRTGDGRRFGFELTFFRQAIAAAARGEGPDRPPSPWDVRDVYLAHFALSDLDGGRFLHDERVNRAGPDDYWFGSRPELLVDRRGDGVDALITRIRAAVEAYPYPASYWTWPGPNSNTFIAYLGRPSPSCAWTCPPPPSGRTSSRAGSRSP